MKFSCDQCHAQYMIADEKVGARGVKVKCKKCSNIIVVKPLAVQEPQASAAAADAGAPSGGALGGLFEGGAPAGDGLGAGVVGGGLGSFGQPAGSFGGGFAGSAAVAASPAPAAPSADFGDIDLGSLGAPAAAPVAARRPAGEKEWYIAIDDSQVGPVDLADIEQRWDAKELDDDSLAWKAGMADWLPIAEVPELAYLVAERPHPRPQARAPAAGGPASVSVGGGPVAFGNDGSNEDITWKPSAASALSSLVQEELVAVSAPKPAPEPPAGVPDLGGFATDGLFAGGAAGAAGPSAPRQDPFAPPPPVFSVPEVRRSSGGSKWMIPVFGVLGIGIVALVGLLFVPNPWVRREVSRPVAAQPAAAPTPPPAAAPAPTAAATPAPAPTPTAPPAAETRPTPRPRHEPREPRQEVARAEPPREEKPRETRRAGDDPLAGIGGGEVKASLTKEDVMQAVKKNAASVAPCLKNARMKGELPPRSYMFTLNWVIQPNGSVSRAQLKGPPEVLETSLPACFASVMRSWRFPASGRELPVSNYPFGPITIR